MAWYNAHRHVIDVDNHVSIVRVAVARLCEGGMCARDALNKAFDMVGEKEEVVLSCDAIHALRYYVG